MWEPTQLTKNPQMVELLGETLVLKLPGCNPEEFYFVYAITIIFSLAILGLYLLKYPFAP